MKKILVMIAAAMMAVTSVNAQNGYDDTKHEVAVTYGVGSTSQWLDVYEEMGTIIFGASYSDSEFTGPYSVEYFYHMKNWLGVGGIFAYGKDTQDMLISNKVVGQNYHRYYTLIPAVKFDWLRTRNFGLYSSVMSLGSVMTAVSKTTAVLICMSTGSCRYWALRLVFLMCVPSLNLVLVSKVS